MPNIVKRSFVIQIAILWSILVCPHSSHAESIVYSFQGGDDGSEPVSKLIELNGSFYGTTLSGGSSVIAPCNHSCGTIFSISPTGAEKILYSFTGGADGYSPAAGLINVGGVLYGTATQGGSKVNCNYGCGTVFKITPDGAFSVVYTFQGGSDGALPSTSLLNVNGVLYGTTEFGGNNTCGLFFMGCGTVFRLTLSGSETVLHVFSGAADGVAPDSLFESAGLLYGVTDGGAVAFGAPPAGTQGTIFKISKTGAFTTLHTFNGPPDGLFPRGGLIKVHGKFYGATSGGGTSTACSGGCGSVFSTTNDGVEALVYSFQDSDGNSSSGPLVAIANVLYGTSLFGGNNSKGDVFSVTLAGSAATLYSFHSGKQPTAAPNALIQAGGWLYGTTRDGGQSGFGSVFKLRP